jgi:tetratricopeptide (TPR) repeat protein
MRPRSGLFLVSAISISISITITIAMSIGTPMVGSAKSPSRLNPSELSDAVGPARIELGCAYVDKIPTCGGMAAIVSKGTLARKSLDQLDEVVAKHPDHWVGYYTRGMNHLHWPRSLLHSDDATVDLEQCIKLQTKASPARPEPYYLRTYVALGDAYTKDKEYIKARKAWKDGQVLFPDSPELKVRLAIADDSALLKFVESKRSLEQPIDTSLAFLDRASESASTTHSSP